MTEEQRRQKDFNKNWLQRNHLRFGQTALHVLAEYAEFAAVVTDAEPSQDERARIDTAGAALLVAAEG